MTVTMLQLRHHKDKLSMCAKGVKGVIALKGANPPLVAVGTGTIASAIVFRGSRLLYPLSRDRLFTVPLPALQIQLSKPGCILNGS